jgi:hypothetical protein
LNTIGVPEKPEAGHTLDPNFQSIQNIATIDANSGVI